MNEWKLFKINVLITDKKKRAIQNSVESRSASQREQSARSVAPAALKSTAWLQVLSSWIWRSLSTAENPSLVLKYTGGNGTEPSVRASISYFMHRRFNKDRQHRRLAPILPAKETKLFPLLFSPPLIPRFTSSAFRKFDCNLGLDKILLLQKLLATW